MEAAAPEGFVHLPLTRSDPFTAAGGPWFAKDEGGRLVAGFRVLDKHLNPGGVCHGGLLATFCDVMMSTACAYAGGDATPVLPTISLSLDYLQPTPAGAWVEMRTDVLRRGRRIAFAQAVLTVEERATVRANGVFSLPAAGPEGPNWMAMLRQLLTSA